MTFLAHYHSPSLTVNTLTVNTTIAHAPTYCGIYPLPTVLKPHFSHFCQALTRIRVVPLSTHLYEGRKVSHTDSYR